MNRRKFLQCGVSTLAIGAGFPLLGCRDSSTTEAAFSPYTHDPVRAENFTNPLFIPGAEGPFGVLNVTDTPLTLKARAATFPILGGKPSPFLLYETSYIGKTYQNPIFKIKRGGSFAATLENGLVEPTIIHWLLHRRGRGRSATHQRSRSQTGRNRSSAGDSRQALQRRWRTRL